MSDDAIVRAVISRLNGETWYMDTRAKDSVLALPYYVIVNGQSYYVSASGKRTEAYVDASKFNGPLLPEVVPCQAPVFPLSADIWDYDNNYWKDKS